MSVKYPPYNSVCNVFTQIETQTCPNGQAYSTMHLLKEEITCLKYSFFQRKTLKPFETKKTIVDAKPNAVEMDPYHKGNPGPNLSLNTKDLKLEIRILTIMHFYHNVLH